MKAIDFIFKRYSPENKRKFVEEMTESELLLTSYGVIERCVKEAGTRRDPKHVLKTLSLDRDIANNHWNSHICRIFQGKIYKKDTTHYLILDVYLQGDDTDTNEYFALKDFLTTYDYIECAKLHESFSNGYEHTVKANYDRKDRSYVIKAILLAYIDNKYKK